MADYFRYVHEGKRRSINQYVKPLRVFKDRDRQLHEYIQSHDILNRDFIQKLSFQEPKTALRNYTKRTGQTFIYINYNTWEKGDIVPVTPVIRTGRRRKKTVHPTRYKVNGEKYKKTPVNPYKRRAKF